MGLKLVKVEEFFAGWQWVLLSSDPVILDKWESDYNLVATCTATELTPPKHHFVIARSKKLGAHTKVALAVKWRESRSVVSDSLWPHGLYIPRNSPAQNTGVGSLALLQGIFPTQGWNPSLPHCMWILCQLSHKGSPFKMDTVYICGVKYIILLKLISHISFLPFKIWWLEKFINYTWVSHL